MSIQKLILIAASGFISCAAIAQTQDSQSIADIARQTRQQKQQQDAQAQAAPANAATPADAQSGSSAQPAQAAKAPHVYTNDEIPEHTGPDVNPGHKSSGIPQENYKGGKQSAEQWKLQIRQLKNNISNLQRQIDNVQNSIHFAGGNYDYHVAYNNRQRAKQQEVENLKSQLDQQQHRLEDLQEEARHQGYSSSVWDP